MKIDQINMESLMTRLLRRGLEKRTCFNLLGDLRTLTVEETPMPQIQVRYISPSGNRFGVGLWEVDMVGADCMGKTRSGPVLNDVIDDMWREYGPIQKSLRYRSTPENPPVRSSRAIAQEMNLK